MCRFCQRLTPQEDEQLARWLEAEVSRRVAARRVHYYVALTFREAREPIVEQLVRTLDIVLSNERASFSIGELFSVGVELISRWIERFRRVGSFLFGAGWTHAMNRMELDVDYAEWFLHDPTFAETAREFARRTEGWHEESLGNIARKIYRKMIRAYLRGERFDLDDLERLVRREFDEMSYVAINRLTRGVTTAGFERGQLEAMRYAGARKRWLSQRDDRVRESHWIADGQEREWSEPFLVGGYLLMHPGDPSAPLREIVNCRCTMLPVLE